MISGPHEGGGKVVPMVKEGLFACTDADGGDREVVMAVGVGRRRGWTSLLVWGMKHFAFRPRYLLPRMQATFHWQRHRRTATRQALHPGSGR